ncbi:MAG: AMP-binding protein, partial [Desulfobacterales bacterium]
TIEMKILDGDGNECPPGVVGEICTRPVGGELPTVEYFGNPEASEKKVRGGWNHSGDMGHADEEGWLFFDHRWNFLRDAGIPILGTKPGFDGIGKIGNHDLRVGISGCYAIFFHDRSPGFPRCFNGWVFLISVIDEISD